VVGTVKIDGQNRLGHTSDAARRIRRRPTSKQGVMPWLLDGAAPPLSESWADRPDAGEASGGGTGADGRRFRRRGSSIGVGERRGGCGGYAGEVRSGGGDLLSWLDLGPTADSVDHVFPDEGSSAKTTRFRDAKFI
jgi:hypothetical protein